MVAAVLLVSLSTRPLIPLMLSVLVSTDYFVRYVPQTLHRRQNKNKKKEKSRYITLASCTHLDLEKLHHADIFTVVHNSQLKRAMSMPQS